MGNDLNTAGPDVAVDPFAPYLAAIDARLSGSRTARGRILDELRAGLADAAAARQEVGADRKTATDAAVAEFGTPEQVADAFAPLLAAASARRRMLRLVQTGPLIGGLWVAAIAMAPAPIWQTPGLFTLVPVVLVAAIATVVAATGLAVAASGRATRWIDVPERVLRPTQTAAGLATTAADLALLTAVTVVVAALPDAIHTAIAVLAAMASLIRLALLARLLVHLRASRTGR